MIGKPAPAFTLRSIDGQSVLSLADLRGSVVVVDFWASWCAPCRQSLPRLASLQAEKGGVRIIAVNIDDDRKNAVEFLRRNRVKLVSLYDEAKRVVDRYAVPSMPSAVVIDRRGVVRGVFPGYTEDDVENIRTEVERLL
jgi:thiol-disulfide isomerase/thioredoxin